MCSVKCASNSMASEKRGLHYFCSNCVHRTSHSLAYSSSLYSSLSFTLASSITIVWMRIFENFLFFLDLAQARNSLFSYAIYFFIQWNIGIGLAGYRALLFFPTVVTQLNRWPSFRMENNNPKYPRRDICLARSHASADFIDCVNVVRK